MKKFLFLTATLISFGLAPAFGQLGMGGGGQGPHFDGAMKKLYGDTKFFSAQLEIRTTSGESNSVSMPGLFSYNDGKSRFEMDIANVKGSMITPDAAVQMKTMGMDKTVAISRPDLKLTYIIYPGLSSYAEMPSRDASNTNGPDDYKLESVADGKETVDGHDCVKNKMTITDKNGNKQMFTVWNAKDLKNFPVEVLTGEGGRSTTMLYKDIALTKPAASLFEPPSGFTKYSDLQTLMQTEMMKKMGGGGAPTPGR